MRDDGVDGDPWALQDASGRASYWLQGPGLMSVPGCHRVSRAGPPTGPGRPNSSHQAAYLHRRHSEPERGGPGLAPT